MNKLLTKLTLKPDPSPLLTAMTTNQALMGISGLKQFCQLQGYKIPSMNCTHYFRFLGDSRSALEWLLACNFLPLMYTGLQPDMGRLQKYNYWLDNVNDTLENETGRYSFKLDFATGYAKHLNKDTVLPHMILDFRGLEELAFGTHHEVQEFMTEVCDHVASLQDGLTKIEHPDYERATWDVEHDHNPMITVLTDWTGSYACSPLLAKYEEVHSQVVTDTYEGCSRNGTACTTYVRKYTKEELANS